VVQVEPNMMTAYCGRVALNSSISVGLLPCSGLGEPLPTTVATLPLVNGLE